MKNTTDKKEKMKKREFNPIFLILKSNLMFFPFAPLNLTQTLIFPRNFGTAQ